MKLNSIIDSTDLTRERINEWFKLRRKTGEQPEQNPSKQYMLEQIGKWWDIAKHHSGTGLTDPNNVMWKTLEHMCVEQKRISLKLQGYAIPMSYANTPYDNVKTAYLKLLKSLPKEITGQ